MNRPNLLDLIAARAGHITRALAATGKTIEFRDKEFRPTTGAIEDRSDAFLDLAANKATIWSAHGLALHHIFHILLHLHRYWVEGLPQLWDKDTGCDGMVHDIESAYEHLVIIPVEIAHFPDAYSYWVNYAEEGLYQCCELASATKGPSNDVSKEIKSKLFQLYLLAQAAFPRAQVATSIAEEAGKQGLLDEFSALAKIVFKNFENKAFVAETLCLYRADTLPARLGLRWVEAARKGEGQQFHWTLLKDYQSVRAQPCTPVCSVPNSDARISPALQPESNSTSEPEILPNRAVWSAC